MAELLRANKAAKKLDLSVDRLYALTREKIIPCVYLGRQIRWDEDQLDAFIESGGKPWSGGWRKEA